MTSYFSMPIMPTMPTVSMPAMPNISIPSISFPSITLPSLTYPTSLPTSLSPLQPYLPLLAILTLLMLLSYTLHALLIHPRKTPRYAAFDVLDPRGPYPTTTPGRLGPNPCLSLGRLGGSQPLNPKNLAAAERAQYRRNYALHHLGQPTEIESWRRELEASVGMNSAWRNGRAPTPEGGAQGIAAIVDLLPPVEVVTEHVGGPMRTETTEQMTPVRGAERLVATEPIRPIQGLVARMVEIVMVRRSTRAKRAPVRFDDMVFPPGRRVRS